MKYKYILLVIVLSIVLSIILDSWIPFVSILALPILVIIIATITTSKDKYVEIVIVDSSHIPDDYNKYVDDSRFEDKEITH